jgi:hypothetical protein
MVLVERPARGRFRCAGRHWLPLLLRSARLRTGSYPGGITSIDSAASDSAASGEERNACRARCAGSASGVAGRMKERAKERSYATTRLLHSVQESARLVQLRVEVVGVVEHQRLEHLRNLGAVPLRRPWCEAIR